MKLHSREFNARMKEVSRDNLKFVYGIVKAISLFAGTVALINIFYELESQKPLEWHDYKHFILKIILFTTSWLVVLVSYDGVITATIFSVHIPRIKETFYTFSLVILELLMFIVFVPHYVIATDNVDIQYIFGLKLMDYWFLFFGLNAFVANRMLNYALQVTRMPYAEYDKSLQVTINKFRINTATAMEHSFYSYSITFIFFLFLLLKREGQNELIETIEIFYSIILLIAMFKMFYLQHKGRLELFKGI